MFNLTQVKMCQFFRQVSPAGQLEAGSADGVGMGSAVSEAFGGQMQPALPFLFLLVRSRATLACC